MTDSSFSSWKRMLLFWMVFFLGAYGLILLESRQRGEKDPGRPTTYSTGPQGHKALYLWLRDLGVPVERWERPIARLDRKFTVLAILQPELGPDPGEMQGIRNWVRQGGTLILSSAPADPFISFFGIEGVFSFTGAIAPQSHQHRFQPGPYTSGGEKLSRTFPQGFTTSRPEVIFHASDQSGGFIAVVKEGKGRVIAVADPFLFNNHSLRTGDHARLLLNLILPHLGNGAMAVDEYHHGFGRATSVLSHVSRSIIFYPLLQSLVFSLFLWAAMGRRFGAARPIREGNGRSSMEYVRAMARLFQRGEKRNFALESMVRWVEDEGRIHLGHGGENLRKALDSARQSLRGGRITDHGLLNLARRLFDSLENGRMRGRRRSVNDKKIRSTKSEIRNNTQ
jgi:hypothetical protein